MVHILLVDDNIALNGVYASNAISITNLGRSSHDYGVLLSDLVLPGLDGIALLDECHQIRPDTPVVVISGYGDQQLEQLAVQRGAYAFLHKPVDPDAFFCGQSGGPARANAPQTKEVLGDDSVWYPQAIEHSSKLQGDSRNVYARPCKTLSRPSRRPRRHVRQKKFSGQLK